MMKTILRAGLLVALATTAWAQAPAAAPGSITIVGKQMNVPIEGKFKNFSSQIQFDPANPAAGKAAIEVDVASIDFGDDNFNYELRTKPWFDAKTYPKATFTSSAIKALDKDRLEVSGKLSIKSKSADVTVPATSKTDGATRVLNGALPIKRTSFNVGEGAWRDPSVVADEVPVRFHLG